MAEFSSKSKHLKPEQNTDRISTLPDSVLCHILSFLPTRTSVTTSVLSRRWRHLWEHLQVLDLYDENHVCWDEDLFRQFAVFVNSVFALRRSRDVRVFRLTCGYSDSDPDPFQVKSVATWVRAAIGSHLKELDLTIYLVNGPCLVLPQSLFACTKLESLRLIGGIHVQQPLTTVRLLSLKMLHLDIDYVDSIDVLLSGCPVLETLYLMSFDCTEHMVNLRVPSTLKKLTIKDYRSVKTNLEIYTPDLEYLSINENHLRLGFPISVGNLHNVVEANLNVSSVDELGNNLFMLLKAICETKTLYLGRFTTKSLLRAPILELPEFHRLVRLELFLPWFYSGFLMTILQQCNMLQVLIIHKEKEHRVIQNSSQPTGVFDFVVSHLNYFKFWSYQGCEDELAFVGYILRNGLSLERVIIHAEYSFNIEKRHHILKELSVVPRGSNLCQLSFH